MYLLTEKTRELILAGMELEKIYEEIRAYHQTTHLYFTLASVDNFAKNGRVSHVIAKGIGLIGIRIVGTAGPEGTLDFKGKCRGDKKVLVLEDEGTRIQRRQGHHRAQPERGGAAAQDVDRGAVRYLQWRDPPGAGAVLLLFRAGLGDGRV